MAEDKFGAQELYVRKGDGDFKLARFPRSEQSKESHYTFIDATEDLVLVAVNHKFVRVQGNAQIEVTVADLSGYLSCGFNKNEVLHRMQAPPSNPLSLSLSLSLYVCVRVCGCGYVSHRCF